VAADFNHDGNLDVALTLNPNGVAILLGTGGGSFAPPVIYATDQLPNGLTAADLNGDGIVDLVATGSLVDVFLGKGDGTFPTRVDYSVSVFPSQVGVGDFNSDGTCTITPSSLALASGGSGNFSVTVTTSQQVAMSQDRGLHLQLAEAGLLFCVLTLPIFAKRFRLPAGLMMLLALLAILPIAGCGGGSSTKPPSTQNVPPGSYQLTVTATAGSARATQTLTLVVE
jgi:FG-GAP-like repeat